LDVPVSDGENIAMREVEVPQHVVQSSPPNKRQPAPHPLYIHRGSPPPAFGHANGPRADSNIGFGRSNTIATSTPRPMFSQPRDSEPSSVYDRASGIGRAYESVIGPSRFAFVSDGTPGIKQREVNQENTLATLEGRRRPKRASPPFSLPEEEVKNMF
jgi:hypothetical protein